MKEECFFYFGKLAFFDEFLKEDTLIPARYRVGVRMELAKLNINTRSKGELLACLPTTLKLTD